MPSNCSIYGCNNTQKNCSTEVQFFRFPKDELVAKQWVNCCRRQDTINTKNALICSVHFTKDDYNEHLKYKLLGIEKPKNQRALKRDAIPSLSLSSGEYQYDSQQIALYVCVCVCVCVVWQYIFFITKIIEGQGIFVI